MKRILLIMLCALTLCSCNNSSIEGPFAHPPGEPGCHVQKFASLSIFASKFYFHPSSKCQMKLNNERSASSGDIYLSDFEEYLTQQIEDYIGKEFQEWYGYADAKLTSMTLCADDVFMGRQAGENIIDLFEVYCDIPLFMFPDGQLIEYIDKHSPIAFSYQDFIEKECFVPYEFDLVVPSENINKIEKIERSLNFTLTATYNDGEKEITQVRKCQYVFCFNVK